MRSYWVLGGLLLSACQSASERPTNFTACTEPRPQICTRIYRPVCAELEPDGMLKTYPSDCSACSEADVQGYTPGECS